MAKFVCPETTRSPEAPGPTRAIEWKVTNSAGDFSPPSKVLTGPARPGARSARRSPQPLYRRPPLCGGPLSCGSPLPASAAARPRTAARRPAARSLRCSKITACRVRPDFSTPALMHPTATSKCIRLAVSAAEPKLLGTRHKVNPRNLGFARSSLVARASLCLATRIRNSGRGD